jgi:hypothetical protein
MGSLFGHLAARLSPSAENLATEALAYILARSASAKRALCQISASLNLQLPEIRSFRTQLSGEDRSIPDLAGFGPDGRAFILIENKFWAGLTANQPAAYLGRLPENGLLLFVVPQRRLHTIWPDLVVSAGRANVTLPAANLHGHDLLWGQVGLRTLAVTSWKALLRRIEAEVTSAGEDFTLSDVRQLEGLCDHMESTGYLPANMEELTNLEVPRRMLALAELIPELCERAALAGTVSLKGLRPTHFPYGAGRYVRVGAAGGWVGVDYRRWAKYGIGPLWIAFGPEEFGRGAEVLNAIAGWLTSNPIRAFDGDGTAVIPLRILPNATRDVVLMDLLNQIAEIHDLLKGIRNAAVASLPAAPALPA